MASNWFCKISGDNIGPMSSKELKAMAEAGQLTPQHLVRRGKDGKWVPAIRVGGLFENGEPSEETPEKQVLNVTSGNGPGRASPQKPKPRRQQPARNATPQARRPIPTNSKPQPQAQQPAAAANPFGIVTDDATPSSRVSSGRTGGGGGTRRKSQQNNAMIIGSLGVLGLAVVIAIIVMVVQQDEPPPEKGASEMASTATPNDPEGTDIEDLSKPGSRTAGEGGAAPPSEGDPDDPDEGPEAGAGDNGKWIDASADPWEKEGLAVRIVAAERGLPNYRKRPADLPKELLLVTIEVANDKGKKICDYKSWNSAKGVTLTDGANNYSLEKYPRGQVEGQYSEGKIYPEDPVEDLLIFERVTTTLDYLHLELPGSAVGMTGETLRFEIPADMIEVAEENGDDPIIPETPKKKPGRKKARKPKSADEFASEPAEGEDDLLRAAAAEHLDDEGNKVEVPKPPPDNTPKLGDPTLEHYSREFGF